MKETEIKQKYRSFGKIFSVSVRSDGSECKRERWMKIVAESSIPNIKSWWRNEQQVKIGFFSLKKKLIYLFIIFNSYRNFRTVNSHSIKSSCLNVCSPIKFCVSLFSGARKLNWIHAQLELTSERSLFFHSAFIVSVSSEDQFKQVVSVQSCSMPMIFHILLVSHRVFNLMFTQIGLSLSRTERMPYLACTCH